MKAPVLILVISLTMFGCKDRNSPGWYPTSTVAVPQLFAPDVISTSNAQEFGITFTPDSQTAYFTRRVPGERQKIWVSRFEAGAWSAPRVASFSTDVDETPWIAPDGSKLLFASRRQGVFDTTDVSDNLWVIDRTEKGWAPPRPVPGLVNRPRPEGAGWPVGSEINPVIGPDGALYYWTQEPGEGKSPDIYRAEPAGNGFAPGRALDAPINTPEIETHMAFGPGGMMVFQAWGRPGGLGLEDLYVAWPADSGWTDPIVLPAPVNSEANEIFPSFTPDGRFLFFASDRGAEEASWSIWYVDLKALELQRP